jgi:hypothetical protein
LHNIEHFSVPVQLNMKRPFRDVGTVGIKPHILEITLDASVRELASEEVGRFLLEENASVLF